MWLLGHHFVEYFRYGFLGGGTTMTKQLFKLSTGVLAVFALIGTAGAADLRLPVKGTPLLPVFNWTGCYIGGYVGGAWNERDATFTDLGNSTFRAFSGGIVPGRVEGSHSWNAGLDDSFIGGGTLGCNWQPVGSPFVLGIEGEFGYLKLNGSAFDPLLNPTLPVTALRATPDVLGTARVGDWYGMITGRLGYAAWENRVLIYAKGGAAFLPVRASVVDTCNTVATGCGNWTTSTAVDDTLTTWTVGGGIEWAFGNHWTLKGEYMFIGLDNTSTSCNVATTPSGAIVGGGPFCFNHDFGGIHTAKVGLNYRFGSFW
jgi:outer membrane immunogenic protein